MKNILKLIIFLSLSTLMMAQPSAVGLIGPTSSSGVTSLSITYTPKTGNQVVLGLETANSTSNTVCKDSNGNLLTAGTAFTTPQNAVITPFSYTVPANPPTAFTCSWVTARGAMLGGEEYSGVGSVNFGPTSNTGSGSNTNPTVSPVSTVTNDLMVAIIGTAQSSATFTSQTGTLRGQTSGGGGSLAIVDNGSGGSSGSGVTESVTTSSTHNWGAVAIELIPSGGSNCAAPTASPQPGTYTNSVSVTLTAACTTITYCTDTVNTCTPGTNYTTAITLNSLGNNYIRATASQNGSTTSGVTSFAYTLTNQGTNTITGSLQFSPGYLIGGLPSPAQNLANRIFEVTNGITSSDCSSGGGAFVNYCMVNAAGTAYVAVAGAGLHSFVTVFGDSVTGAALTTSEVAYFAVPYPCTISGWHIKADAGTTTVKVWRVPSGGTAVPTVSNSISTNGVSLGTGTSVDSTTVSDFTSTLISANDTLGISLFAVSGAKQITFQLDCR